MDRALLGQAYLSADQEKRLNAFWPFRLVLAEEIYTALDLSQKQSLELTNREDHFMFGVASPTNAFALGI
ncbi:MAG: hypothetical protein V3V02_07125 [Rhizobiaceae bacterium]